MKLSKYILFISLLLISCAQTKVCCPPQDVIIDTTFEGKSVIIPKGFLDDPKNFYTQEEWDEIQERVKKYNKQLEKLFESFNSPNNDI